MAQFECPIDGVKCSGYKVSISYIFIEVPGIGAAPIPGTRTKCQIPGDRCNFSAWDMAKFECPIDGVKCSGYKVSISCIFVEVPGIGAAPVPGTRPKSKVPEIGATFKAGTWLSLNVPSMGSSVVGARFQFLTSS